MFFIADMITGNYTEDFEDVTVTESLDNHSVSNSNISVISVNLEWLNSGT